MRECDTPAADRFLETVGKKHGPGAAKSAKTVGSLLLGCAIRHCAVEVNPFEAVAKIPTGEGKALGVRRAVVDVGNGVIEINAKATFRKVHQADGVTWPGNEHGSLFPACRPERSLTTSGTRTRR